MGLLRCGTEHRATQAMIEANVATFREGVPAFQRSAIEWFCDREGLAYDGTVPPDDYTPFNEKFREMRKAVLKDLALELETVYLCPIEHCQGFRRSKKHDTPCGTCGNDSYYYTDKHGHRCVCILRYFPMATLIRYIFADPLKARHLTETFRDCVPEPNAMSGVYGAS